MINFGFWNESDGDFFADTTKITNLTIKNGFSNELGGGIYFGFGNLVVKNCIVKENQNGCWYLQVNLTKILNQHRLSLKIIYPVLAEALYNMMLNYHR